MQNKQVAIEIMKLAQDCACNLEGKNIMFVYRNQVGSRGLDFIETRYRPDNFLHLMGVYIDHTKMTAEDFYKKALNSELTEIDFRQGMAIGQPPTRQDYITVEKKLQAADQTMQIHKRACLMGEWNGFGYKFYTERVIGNVYAFLGYVSNENSNIYQPNSSQLADVRDFISHKNTIMLTLRKPASEEHYSEITRLHKSISLDTFKLPENIVEKLSDKAKIALSQPTEKEITKQTVKADEKPTETPTEEKEADTPINELAVPPPTTEKADTLEDSYVLELDEDEEPEKGKETGDDIDIDDDEDLEL
jgi:hypothetical protein